MAGRIIGRAATLDRDVVRAARRRICISSRVVVIVEGIEFYGQTVVDAAIAHATAVGAQHGDSGAEFSAGTAGVSPDAGARTPCGVLNDKSDPIRAGRSRHHAEGEVIRESVRDLLRTR